MICVSTPPVPFTTSISAFAPPHSPSIPSTLCPLSPSTLPRYFSGEQGWIVFECFSLCTYHISLFFFRIMQGTAPLQCQHKRTQGGFSKEKTMNSSSLVRVFSLVYFFLLWLYVLSLCFPILVHPTPSPFVTPPPPPSSPAPCPLFPSLLLPFFSDVNGWILFKLFRPL